MTIRIDTVSFDAGIADVHEALRGLHADRRTIDHRVRDFLGTGWTGVAAEAFADAWEAWSAAAGEVQDALEGMGLLLTATHRDLAEQDTRSQQSLDSVAATLIDRLG